MRPNPSSVAFVEITITLGVYCDFQDKQTLVFHILPISTVHYLAGGRGAVVRTLMSGRGSSRDIPSLGGVAPSRRNGGAVAPERRWRCAGTATPFYWNRRGLRLFVRAHGYFGEMPGVGASLSNRKRTSEKRGITHAKGHRTQRGGIMNRVENVGNGEGVSLRGAAYLCVRNKRGVIIREENVGAGRFVRELFFHTLLQSRQIYAKIADVVSKQSRQHAAWRWNVRNVRRARSEASVCVQVPPPPLFARGAVTRLYAALGACVCAVSDGTAAGGFSLFHPLLDKEVLQGCLGCSCGKSE